MRINRLCKIHQRPPIVNHVGWCSSCRGTKTKLLFSRWQFRCVRTSWRWVDSSSTKRACEKVLRQWLLIWIGKRDAQTSAKAGKYHETGWGADNWLCDSSRHWSWRAKVGTTKLVSWSNTDTSVHGTDAWLPNKFQTSRLMRFLPASPGLATESSADAILWGKSPPDAWRARLPQISGVVQLKVLGKK